jgi:hypothetical protein
VNSTCAPFAGRKSQAESHRKNRPIHFRLTTRNARCARVNRPDSASNAEHRRHALPARNFALLTRSATAQLRFSRNSRPRQPRQAHCLSDQMVWLCGRRMGPNQGKRATRYSFVSPRARIQRRESMCIQDACLSLAVESNREAILRVLHEIRAAIEELTKAKGVVRSDGSGLP